MEGARLAQKAGSLSRIDLPASTPLKQPKKPEWGDFSAILPIQLAKSHQLDALTLAQTIQQHLPEADMIGGVSISAPGYINIKLSKSWLASQVDVILEEGEHYADPGLGRGQKAQVEFISANPTGPLSASRGRAGVIGDTLANVLSAAGYDVTREYYYNEAANVARDLGDSLQLRYLQALGLSVEYPQHLNQGDYLADLGKQLAREYGDSLARQGWEFFKVLAQDAILEGIKKTLARLNIHFDVFFNENTLYEDGSVLAVVDSMRKKGHLYEREGSAWFSAKQLGAQGDRMVVKPSGDPTYWLPDIAYHINKLDRGFKLIVDVLSPDYKDAFPDVMRGLQALGYDISGIKLVLNQMVTVKGSQQDTGPGGTILLDELINAVGPETVRLTMLARSAESHLEFDVNTVIEQTEKNPVHLVRSARTRLKSILRLAALAGFSRGAPAYTGDTGLLDSATEIALIRQLVDLPEVMLRAAIDLAPHLLAAFTNNLTVAFHTFDRDSQIVDQDEPELSLARTKLVQATLIALDRSLALLGVEPGSAE